jgi:hypothetical protein
MASTLERATIDTVKASVQFGVKAGEPYVSLVREPGAGPDQRAGTYVEREIVVRNGRPLADQLDLDREGFKLMRYGTAMKDFYDEAEVRRVYYPEMDRLVKEVTGCAKVIVFDHTVRVDDPDQQAARKVRAPVPVVHNDFTVRSAPQRVRDLLPPDEAEQRLGKRYGSINVWRPIRGPVETAPLVVCGWNDIAEEDLIAAERRYQDRIGGIYNLAYNPDQRWFYFPRMERDEVVILKCFDSLADGTARWTAHGSFKNPTSPAGARPRESIEIRTLYFFD